LPFGKSRPYPRAAGWAGAHTHKGACDPVSFNAAGIPCARIDRSGKKVTIDELLARVQKDHAHGAWRFKSDDVKVKAGEPVSVRLSRGGEFHTFTKVARFGPGCVPELNVPIFGAPDPAPECAPVDTPGGPVPAPFVFDGIRRTGPRCRSRPPSSRGGRTSSSA
jgi:hypothetical protein